MKTFLPNFDLISPTKITTTTGDDGNTESNEEKTQQERRLFWRMIFARLERNTSPLTSAVARMQNQTFTKRVKKLIVEEFEKNLTEIPNDVKSYNLKEIRNEATLSVLIA